MDVPQSQCDRLAHRFEAIVMCIVSELKNHSFYADSNSKGWDELSHYGGGLAESGLRRIRDF